MLNRNRSRIGLVAAAVFAVSLLTPAALAKPPVFSTMTYDQAVAKAKAEDKLVIVDAMASWCGPCKMMDAKTWPSRSVLEWVRANAYAIQFDVDNDRKLSEKFGISAMPTIVALRNGQEVGRQVGGVDADTLIAWLDEMNGGKSKRKTAAAKPATAATPVTPAGSSDSAAPESRQLTKAQAKLTEARRLAANGKAEDAAAAYAGAWTIITQASIPDAGDMSTAASEMTKLASSSPVAKKAFAQLRDAAAPSDKDPIAIMPGPLSSWAALNDVLGETNKTLVWFDKVKSAPANAWLLDRVDLNLGPALVAKQRWDDVKLVVAAAVKKDHAKPQHADWLTAAEKAGHGDVALMAQVRAGLALAAK